MVSNGANLARSRRLNNVSGGGQLTNGAVLDGGGNPNGVRDLLIYVRWPTPHTPELVIGGGDHACEVYALSLNKASRLGWELLEGARRAHFDGASGGGK